MTETQHSQSPQKADPKMPAQKTQDSYAVVATGGVQYTLHQGQKFKVTHIPNVKEGDTIHLEQVLCVLKSSGEVMTGKALEGKSVVAIVGASVKDKTIVIFRKKRRKNYRRTIGARPKHHWLSVVSLPSV